MLIPDNIDRFESTGEKILYVKFKNDGSTEKMYVLHSLFTNYHFKNICGEIDFLVLAPNKGIFAIEVKHGKVSRKNGTWFFENRIGSVTSKKISPFAQVTNTMYSIRNYILNKVQYDKKLYDRFFNILWGTGVAFTSMNEFVDFGPEGHSWQVLTRHGLKLPVGAYINTLSKGWHNYNKNKYWYDVNISKPTDTDCNTILKILRGDFDINYLEINKISDIDHIIEEYTKEQFHLLDFVRYNDRCLIEGSAGTGKTLMAMEITRSEIEKGSKVGLFCFNKQLGHKLLISISELNNNNISYAGTFHSFLIKNIDSSLPFDGDNLHKFYSEELSIEFILQNDDIDEIDKFDLIVLDEAQDLITPFYLEVVDIILKGGLKKGRWIFLGDFSNQAIFLNNPDKDLDALSEITMFTRFPPLKINCRNTKKIAIQNTLLTGIDVPDFTYNSVEGDLIVNKFPKIDLQEKIIMDILSELQNKKIPLNKISLLSPKKFNNTFLRDSVNIAKLVTKGLIISTIQAYKGLENTIVILFDFDEISNRESIRLLYVGVSRARQKLFIVFRDSLEEDYKTLVKTNFKRLS